MGADIHIMLERKINGQWYMWHKLDGVPRRALDREVKPTPYDHFYRITDRNYEFFAAIAGVRGPGPEPRGIPEDLSVPAQEEIECWAGNGHSHTWLYANELCELFLQHHMTESEVAEFTENQLTGRAFSGWEYIMNYYIVNTIDNEPAHNYRFIIFFDN